MSIDRKLLHDQVRDQLMSLITAGQIESGERLVELDLARQFGVSQAPVREALRDLQAVGLVRIEPHRGTFASDFGDKGSKAIRDIFEVRAALEELGTRLALPNLANRIDELQHEVDNMCAAAANDDAHGLKQSSERFHAMIMTASDNATLVHMWRELDITAHTLDAVDLRSERLLPLAESHQRIVDSIASGDVDVACTEARLHQTIVEAIPQG